MDHFILDGRYEDLFSHYNLNVEEALKKSDIPEDCFKKTHPLMSEEQYYNFMSAIGNQINDPSLPIQIATTAQIETFSPPIFAAYSSKNGEVFINRLAKYKRLIGPLSFKLEEDDTSLTVTLQASSPQYTLPQFIVLSEFAFLVGIMRKTTKEEIIPKKITMISPINNEKVNDFFKIKITKYNKNSITFSKSDLNLSFISYNPAMWNYFKPELIKRLSELDVDASVSSRVRSALTELLPSGEFSIDDVARKLGYSKRTLQRKLKEENTSFQKQLNSTREILAINYLNNTYMVTNDIAFLLGYQELNSFLRAFTVWKGISPSEYRNKSN